MGQTFFNRGAQHVICVLREEKILDKACSDFAREFY